jgi:hypothetical protein
MKFEYQLRSARGEIIGAGKIDNVILQSVPEVIEWNGQIFVRERPSSTTHTVLYFAFFVLKI